MFILSLIWYKYQDNWKATEIEQSIKQTALANIPRRGASLAFDLVLGSCHKHFLLILGFLFKSQIFCVMVAEKKKKPKKNQLLFKQNENFSLTNRKAKPSRITPKFNLTISVILTYLAIYNYNYNYNNFYNYYKFMHKRDRPEQTSHMSSGFFAVIPSTYWQAAKWGILFLCQCMQQAEESIFIYIYILSIWETTQAETSNILL